MSNGNKMIWRPASFSSSGADQTVAVSNSPGALSLWPEVGTSVFDLRPRLGSGGRL